MKFDQRGDLAAHRMVAKIRRNIGQPDAVMTVRLGLASGGKGEKRSAITLRAAFFCSRASPSHNKVMKAVTKSLPL